MRDANARDTNFARIICLRLFYLEEVAARQDDATKNTHQDRQTLN